MKITFIVSAGFLLCLSLSACTWVPQSPSFRLIPVEGDELQLDQVQTLMKDFFQPKGYQCQNIPRWKYKCDIKNHRLGGLQTETREVALFNAQKEPALRASITHMGILPGDVLERTYRSEDLREFCEEAESRKLFSCRELPNN